MALSTAELYELDAVARARGLTRSQAMVAVREARQQAFDKYAGERKAQIEDLDALKREVIDHVQAFAIARKVWRGKATDLARLLAERMGSQRAPDIERALHDQDLQRDLAAHRDIGLWRGADKDFRLVDHTPLGVVAARLRIANHPGGKTCRFCLLTESLDSELEQESGPAGPIPGSYIHQNCKRAWRQIRAAVERLPEIS